MYDILVAGLDLRRAGVSSAPLDEELLNAMPAQAKLRSLGLSFIPDLPHGVVSEGCAS